MLQKQVGKAIGVTSHTVMNWEKDRAQPEVKYYPKIMAFLGYCPIQHASTFSNLVRLHRTHRGLSIKQAAQEIGIDPASLSAYEAGNKPLHRILAAMHKF